MNKQALIDVIKTKGEFESKAAAERALNAVLESVKEGLATAGEVQIIGFGTFAVKERAERTGRNPKTGAEIKIEASKTVSFKAGAALKAVAEQK
jgi:DNA-binding protein HU-beta